MSKLTKHRRANKKKPKKEVLYKEILLKRISAGSSFIQEVDDFGYKVWIFSDEADEVLSEIDMDEMSISQLTKFSWSKYERDYFWKPLFFGENIECQKRK